MPDRAGLFFRAFAERERARLLLDVLLGDPARVERAASRLDACEGWAAALGRAAAWNVAPTLFERMNLRRDPDGDCAAALSGARARVAISTLCSTSALRHAAEVQAELAHARVPAVAIGGVASIATLYGGASRRKVTDVQLIVHAGDLAAAGAALERAGYEDVSYVIERPTADATTLQTLRGFARTFVRDDFEIDLRWQIGAMPPAGLSAERIHERALRTRIAGHTLVVAGPLESALLTVYRALRGGFAARGTVEDLVDLAAWWRRSGPDERASIVGAALASGLGSSLVALSHTLAIRDETFVGRPAIAALERRLGDPGRAEARRLHRFLEDALGTDAADDAIAPPLAPGVYARSIANSIAREATGDVAVAPAASPSVQRRGPLHLRMIRRLRNGLRIASKLGHVRRRGRYRAVARAQNRIG